MNHFDLKTESEKWDHPYRIQVTNSLRLYEVIDFIKQNTGVLKHYAIEKRSNKFVLWRAPEQSWDVDDASLEWLEEWNKFEPPPLEKFVDRNRYKHLFGDVENMNISENRLRRDEAIRAEYEHYRKQGFKSTHVYKVLGEKYFLSTFRIRDIVSTQRELRKKNARNK